LLELYEVRLSAVREVPSDVKDYTNPPELHS